MNVQVTKDNVTILSKDNIHEGEYKINELLFEFSEEYSSDLVINAVFTNELGKAYQVSIIDNKCHIPAEILAETGQVLLGVYAYKVNGKELELRYSPFPTSFVVLSGSYDPTAEESQEITPTQYEQYMQALQDGLNQVQDSINELNQATDSANDLVDEINQKLANGEFVGPQGPKGDPGEVTEETLDNVIPKQTATDSIINVNDALKYKTFNFKVDGAYEQNGEPTPQEPIPITTLSFDKITKNGQNLYNVRDAYTEGYDPYNSAYQVDEDDWVTLNIQGAPSDYNYYSLYTNNLKLKPDTDYNIILEVKAKSGIGTLSVVSQRIEGETQVEGQFNGSFSNSFGNFGPGIYTKKLRTLNKEELENTVCGLRTFISLDKGNYSSMTFRISVIEDTSVTPENFVYQPYQETNYLIDLQDNEMVSLPNGVKDELVVDKGGNVSLIKKVGKFIVAEDDMESFNTDWYTLLNYVNLKKPLNYIGYESYDLSISYNNILMDKFYQSPDHASRETYDEVYSFIPFQGQYMIGLTFPKTTTFEEVKPLIIGTTVYYELAEPQTISLGKLSDIITTEQGSNTFAINGNIDTQISITYALDIKKYIDNKISTVSQAVIEQE